METVEEEIMYPRILSQYRKFIKYKQLPFQFYYKLKKEDKTYTFESESFASNLSNIFVVRMEYYRYKFESFMIDPCSGERLPYHPQKNSRLKEKNKANSYLVFESYLDFYKHVYSNPFFQNDKFFNEVMIKEERKIHFDIDIKKDVYEKIENFDIKELRIKLVLGCKLELKSKGFSFECKKDLIILSSCKTENGICLKYSYHVILPTFICNRIIDMKEFFRKVMFHIPIKYHPCFDKSIYQSNQCLRIINCSKIDDVDRILKEDLCDIPQNQLHNRPRDLVLLEKTLITYMSGEEKLIHYPELESKPKFITDKEGTGDIFNKIKDQINLPKGIEFMNESSNFINFKNEKGYMCPNCQRIHENENPYILISNKNKVYFYCRRKEKGIIIGQL